MQGLTEEGECDGVVCIPVPEPSSTFIRSQGTGNADKLSRKLSFWVLFAQPIPPQLGPIIDSAGNKPATPVSANSPNTAVNARKDVDNVRSTVRFQMESQLTQIHTTGDHHYRCMTCQHLDWRFFQEFGFFRSVDIFESAETRFFVLCSTVLRSDELSMVLRMSPLPRNQFAIITNTPRGRGLMAWT